MPYKRKKTGTKRESRSRYNPVTQETEIYYVDVDVFSNVWESSSYDSGSNSYDSGGGSSYDTGGSYGGSE